jgi:hypothetical protein
VAALDRLRAPPSIQGVRGLVVFGLAGGMDGPLDQPGCPLPPRGLQALHLQVNLVRSLGEAPQQLPGQALELPVPIGVRWRPLDPERPGQLPLVAGPVDGVGGQPVPVQVPAVQRRPTSVRPLRPVGHHQVGVQQRITLPAGAVVEPDRQQPLSGHVLVAAVAAACPKVSVQVGDRLSDTSVMGGQHRLAGGRIAEAVQDRDALGRTQDHIKGGHRVAAVGAAKELTSVGVAALEHALEARRRCFALQPKRGGAGAVPASRGLTVAGQILLVIGGQLAGVVRLPPHRQLGNICHHPAVPLPAVVGASKRTRGALLSSEKWFGVRVRGAAACSLNIERVIGCGFL